MKHPIRFFLFSAAFMLLIPVALFCRTAEAPAQDPAEPIPAAVSYRVLRTGTGETEEVSVRDYLIGAVAAEMPASYCPEALKAQAVASHTYAERIRRQNAANPDPALNGADFSDDSRFYQAFASEAELRAQWGDQFRIYYDKVAAAVDAVSDLLICWEDEPIVAAFHAVSPGRTEDAGAVWGTALPYLVPVSSDADCSAPSFAEKVTLPPETVRNALLSAEPALSLPEDPAEWFAEAECTESGTVLQMHCGTAVLSGSRLREALGLRSACMTVSYEDGLFTFRTKGFGHGVGMSQFGAGKMAARGSGFREILLHYYPGTVCRKTC
ncbi:MAG: stage II sporulation protein D [Oscillospiraceae bacterium]|nr:stage II sporulation protein D [Oscillospiraceae bacterium]